MELLTVVVIIGLLSALATPSFLAMIRDRRVASAAQLVADMHREARTRALSRGNAVLVRWVAAGSGKGTMEMRESIILPAGVGVVKSCTTADWVNGSADTRGVDVINFASGEYQLVEMKLLNENGADASFLEICFAADGRTYRRYQAVDSFLPLTGVPSFEVKNNRTNLKRTVFVPPNGVARLAL